MSKLKLLRKLFYIYEKVQCHLTVLVVTPGIMIFQMTIVRPALIELYKMGTVKQMIHIILPIFCFINVTGNMIMSIFCDTSLRKEKSCSTEGDSYCEICKIRQPPKAWHCQSCNICILHRDHHCFFFSTCIGMYNRRYYIIYLAYIFISMIYCMYYNYFFVSSKFKEEYDFALSMVRIVNPMLRYMLPDELNIKDLYVLFFLLNVGLVVWSGILFWFHLKNVLRGLTAREYKDTVTGSNWKNNVLRVLGRRWYLAIIWPFADSPLVENSDFIVKVE